jgi:hypothetical protein
VRFGLALIVAGAAASISSTALTAAEVLRTTITIRVYQSAGLPATLEQRALAEAETLLGAAFVDVVWRRCTGPKTSTSCDEPLGPSEISLRILKEGAPVHDRSAALGNAFVDRHAGGGVLATVYFNHVAWLAKLAGTDVAVVLGRAAAHELGHLLLRTSRHPQRGLMRPNWTVGEVRRNRASDWTFTAGDVAALRRPAETSAARRADATR